MNIERSFGTAARDAHILTLVYGRAVEEGRGQEQARKLANAAVESFYSFDPPDSDTRRLTAGHHPGYPGDVYKPKPVVTPISQAHDLVAA